MRTVNRIKDGIVVVECGDGRRLGLYVDCDCPCDGHEEKHFFHDDIYFLFLFLVDCLYNIVFRVVPPP